LLLIYTLLGTLTYPVHFLFPATEVGQLYGGLFSGKHMAFFPYVNFSHRK